jgi:antitoxin (DNA-binding transcriptional repressor) of toxin-antitoxin stability system
MTADRRRLEPARLFFAERIIAMPTVTLGEAKAHLDELIEHLQPGEEILIVDQGRPLAHVKKAERNSWPCKAGSAAGKIHIAPDFDEPLEDFQEYME